MASELELVETNDLLEELGSRFDHAVFVGRKDVWQREERVLTYWNGDMHVVIGMLAHMQSSVISRLERESYLEEGDDDDLDCE